MKGRHLQMSNLAGSLPQLVTVPDPHWFSAAIGLKSSKATASAVVHDLKNLACLPDHSAWIIPRYWPVCVLLDILFSTPASPPSPSLGLHGLTSPAAPFQIRSSNSPCWAKPHSFHNGLLDTKLLLDTLKAVSSLHPTSKHQGETHSKRKYLQGTM